MGYRISWIARRGTSTRELLEVLKTKPTGDRHDVLDVGLYLLELPKAENGPWNVLITDGSEYFDKLNDAQAKSLSAQGQETIYFWCSDTVMVTAMTCFKDGQQVWSINYDCQDTEKKPLLSGDVPEMTHALLKDLRTQQTHDPGADYIYDITAALGHKLVGFRHDSDCTADDPEPFQLLAVT